LSDALIDQPAAEVGVQQAAPGPFDRFGKRRLVDFFAARNGRRL